jgi:hypothetical protein
MLPVHDRATESGLTLLEEFRVAPVGNAGRLEAEHGPQGQRALVEFSLGHGHPPVGGEQFVSAARAALLNVAQESFAMKHQRPISPGRHEHFEWSGVGLSVRAGSGVLE